MTKSSDTTKVRSQAHSAVDGGRAGRGRADENQIEFRAAWPYFMEDHTQAEVARRLGTTLLRISRLLGEVGRSGLVGISLNSQLASCVELEQALNKEFGLGAAVIVLLPRTMSRLPASSAVRRPSPHLAISIGTGFGVSGLAGAARCGR
jgi:hypothetical protein